MTINWYGLVLTFLWALETELEALRRAEEPPARPARRGRRNAKRT